MLRRFLLGLVAVAAAAAAAGVVVPIVEFHLCVGGRAKSGMCCVPLAAHDERVDDWERRVEKHDDPSWCLLRQ